MSKKAEANAQKGYPQAPPPAYPQGAPPAYSSQGAPPPYMQQQPPQAAYYNPQPMGQHPYGAPPQHLPPQHPAAMPHSSVTYGPGGFAVSQQMGGMQQSTQYGGGAPSTVVVQGGFDAGARFDGVAQPNIPPPPPGVMPNAAQMAAAHGQNVVVTQRKGNFWEGSGSGGYTFF